MKKIASVLLTAVIVLISSGYVSANNENPIKIAKEFIPPNSILVSPNKSFSTPAVQSYDFNQDGQDEIIATFKIKPKEYPAPSQYGIMVLDKGTKGWEKIWETKRQGVNLDFSGLADITGDGIKEFLFGVTIGAAVGSELEIFQWNDQSLQKISSIPYHKLELIKGDHQEGLAVWKWYLADSYLVDVVNWDGEKFANDKQLYTKYYPVIEEFYEEKISKMNAWFYWYCLADAQIKANLPEKASKSIEEGILLANKLSMPEVIQELNELKKELTK